MKKSYYSKTLADLYENQGYYEEALEQLKPLYEQNEDQGIAEAIERLQQKANEPGSQRKRARVTKTAEQWIKLMLLTQQVESCKQVKKQVE